MFFRGVPALVVLYMIYNGFATVGFIRELPDELMAAFRTTLEELQHADLLIHVVVLICVLLSGMLLHCSHYSWLFLLAS